MEIQELRSGDRYVVAEPVSGSFGATSVSILDVGMKGAGITHAQPIRIGTRGRFWFRRGDIAASAQAVVVWSHLSKTPDEHGKLLYRSGLRIEEGSQLAEALQALATRGIVRHDSDTLERKRRRIAERENERNGKPTMKVLSAESELPPDQVLLIRHSRDRLLTNEDEVRRWSNKAKVALSDRGVVTGEILRYSDPVLAVWAYLEKSVDLGTIVKVFEKK